MEIRTCEEYVISKLNETENALHNTQMALKACQANLQATTDDLTFIVGLLNYHKGRNNENECYFEMSAWSTYDSIEYNKIVDILARLGKTLGAENEEI